MAALASLQVHYSPQQLVTSGLAQAAADDRLVFRPFLTAPDVAIVVLQDSVTGEFRNLMTEFGCVLGNKAPMFEVLGDKHTYDALDRGERDMFLTDTIADTILLRSFGLAAAPISGLAQLNQQDIDLLCEYYGFKQGLSERERDEQLVNKQEGHGGESVFSPRDPLQNQAASTSTAGADTTVPTFPTYIVPGSGYVGTEQDDFIRLTLVRWTPHLVSTTDPISMQSAIDELKALRRHRRLDIDEVNEWTPAESDLDAIRFALSRGEPNWIKGALLDSAYSNIGQIALFKTNPIVIAPPTDLAGAVEELQTAMLGTTEDKSRQRRKEALHNYHRVISLQITRPMLRQAEATADPLDRALQLQFVQLNALFLEKAPTVREHVLLNLVQQREDSVKEGNKSVSELLAISSQMVSLAKEMKKWKPHSRSAPRSLPSPKLNHSRRFADSDLVMQN